jgi:hypothetical protein
MNPRIRELWAAGAIAVALAMAPWFVPPPAQASQSPIALTVDATEAPRRVLHAKLHIPAAPGALTLLYPKLIPGEHGPTGPIQNVAGISSVKYAPSGAATRRSCTPFCSAGGSRCGGPITRYTILAGAEDCGTASTTSRLAVLD